MGHLLGMTFKPLSKIMLTENHLSVHFGGWLLDFTSRRIQVQWNLFRFGNIIKIIQLLIFSLETSSSRWHLFFFIVEFIKSKDVKTISKVYLWVFVQ